MNVQELLDWLRDFDLETEVRVLGERNAQPIANAARPIIATLEPIEGGPFDFVVLVEPGL